MLGALGGSAQAGAAPGAAGSQLDAWVTAEADHRSGRRLAVLCSFDPASWANMVSSAGLATSHESEVYGFSLIAEGTMYLQGGTCRGGL